VPQPTAFLPILQLEQSMGGEGDSENLFHKHFVPKLSSCKRELLQKVLLLDSALSHPAVAPLL
jgi:hypothetical protein